MNPQTIIIAALIAVIFIAIVANEIIQKRKGKSTCACGGSCDCCGGECRLSKNTK